ncbi:MAG: DUF2148 domain-containing protein [Desulfatiglans sp.]|jgi:uncharacterized ferredoxin-like protein|nr:DUF2148 domain-containing protein [Thermodesulfobacteriota bacterium]MEE4354180.1 DUF2148 domain-containing protein [Desulfatiglans sp.]
MAIYDGDKTAGEEGLLEVARLCVMAANKVPTLTGKKVWKTEIVTGEDIESIIEVLEALGEISPDPENKGLMGADGATLRAILDQGMGITLLMIGGVDLHKGDLNWNCGACGFETCAAFNKEAAKIKKQMKEMGATGIQAGPQCVWKFADYSQACGWAAAAAWQNNVENRILGSVAMGAKLIGMMPDCFPVVGVALGPLVDTWWYSRPALPRRTREQFTQALQRCMPQLFSGFAGRGDPLFRYSAREFQRNQMKLRPQPVSELIAPNFKEQIPPVVAKIGQIRAKSLARHGIEEKDGGHSLQGMLFTLFGASG